MKTLILAITIALSSNSNLHIQATPLDDIIDTIVLSNYDSILENDDTIGEDEDYFYNFYGTERY